jgi:hypothetical protein
MASGLTPTYLIPYPLATDPVDVHGDMFDMADRIEDVLLLKANLNTSNTFTSTNVFSVNSATTAVRITQTGSGEAFRVEDSTNPDASAFIIDAAGDTTLGKDLIFRGSTSGLITLTATATAGTNTLTLPALTGTLAINVTTTLGDIIYASANGTPGTLARLAGNTSATRSFLGQTGTGSASAAPSWTSSTGSNNVVLSTSPTITTPVIDTINVSAASVAAALWNTTLTTGSISMGGALTSGSVNIANGTALAAGTVNIASGAGTGNKTVNIGTSATSGTTAVNIGSASGATSTIALNGAVTVGGDMTINGTLTTINSNSLTVDDKNIELGGVTAGTISATGTVGSISGTGPWTATITGMTDTADLIPGSAISATNGTGSLGSGGTYIVASIVSNTSITYTATGGTTPTAGTVTNITTTGATDSTANGGGVILKGTTDKTLLWDSTNANWTSSENFNLVTGKVYKINNVSVLSSTTLGSGVTSSSLTSFGTSPTLTTPVIDTINASGAAVAASLWNTIITTGSISTGGALTTGSINIANGSTFNGTVNIASGVGTVNKAINIGTGSTSGTTTIIIGSSGGATGANTINGTSTFTGQIISTRANSTADGTGQIYLNGATGNRIDFNVNGVAAPTFTTRSTGTKIVLYPVVGVSSADYAIGIESGALWQSVGTSSNSFKWYAGTTQVAALTGAGAFSAVTKSFDIPHPTRGDKRLRYASLEGPENGVYIRGKSEEKMVMFPDYWSGLVHRDSVTVQLTAIGNGTVYVDDIKHDSVIVGGTAEKFFYFIQAERKDVDKLIVEY